MELFSNKKDKAMEALEDAQRAQAAQEAEGMAAEEKEAEKPKKKAPWAIWEVGGREYKLKLTTPKIMELEKKYKTNLMNIMGTGDGGMPALTVMLDVAHAAMEKFEHGMKLQDVIKLFDKYEAEGGSQLEFYTKVYMNIFAVSGFFSTSLTEQMQDSLEEATTIM